MVELLKQGQYTPFDAIDQVISIFAGSKGLLDDVPLPRVRAFESDLLEYFRGPAKALRDQVVEKKSFKGLEEQVLSAMKTFKSNWRPPA